MAQFSINLEQLTGFLIHQEEKNHLFIIDNLFRDMLPPYAVSKCELSASLTVNGNISLILEAVNPGDYQLCRDALQSITTRIKRSASLQNTPRKFEMAAFLNLESWLKNQAVDIQDTVFNAADDLQNQARVKFGETVLDVNDRIQNLPNSGAQTPMPTCTLALFVITLVIERHL